MDDFDPLLPAGIHDTTMEELPAVVVDPFDEKEHRDSLVERLTAFVNLLKEIGLSGEIWINGSFVTQKPRPNDVDLVFVASSAHLEALSDEQRTAVATIFNVKRDETRIRYSCDAYITSDDLTGRSYWRGLFGFSRGEQPKGFLRITI